MMESEMHPAFLDAATSNSPKQATASRLAEKILVRVDVHDGLRFDQITNPDVVLVHFIVRTVHGQVYHDAPFPMHHDGLSDAWELAEHYLLAWNAVPINLTASAPLNRRVERRMVIPIAMVASIEVQSHPLGGNVEDDRRSKFHPPTV
jgi:hypothetical protein